ncbi:MAG: hypothetical protein QOG57_3708 [Pseudonocardiales bacterium]|nr:hypothetical protein [Pseudonocardiales bacterium]
MLNGSVDVHQHLWPSQLVAALRARCEPPRLAGWTLHLAGEPAAQSIREALRSWGWVHLNPFMSVSTLTLPVSPSLKITDLSLVDVVRRAPVPSTL